MTVLKVSVDRELVMGIVFLLLNPLILLFIRVTNPVNNRIVQLFRMFYAQLLYFTYFSECIILSQLFFNNMSYDRIFADLEYLIFHCQPAVEFSKIFEKNRYINELFFFSYFFYFFLITSGWWFLFIRKRYKEAANCLFIVSTSFAILYIWYVFFPVKGPKYFFESLYHIWYDNFEGFFFTNLMKGIFSSMNLGGAAFPSSHVAIGLIALFFNWKYNRFIVPVFLPLTILLLFSTVYLYAHYFVDIAAGILAAIPLYWCAGTLAKHVEALMVKLGNFFKMRLNYKEIALG